MEMFVKRVDKNTLESTFRESIKVYKDMLSLKENPIIKSSSNTIDIKNETTMTKYPDDKKKQESIDMEAFQRIVKKLSNEIIDLKKNCGEGSSNPKKGFEFQPKKLESTPPTTKMTPHSKGTNMEYFVQSLKT